MGKKLKFNFKLFLFLKFNLYCIFHYHLGPLSPSPPSNHHTGARVRESFFLCAQSLPLLSPPLAVILPSMSLSPFSSLKLFLEYNYAQVNCIQKMYKVFISQPLFSGFQSIFVAEVANYPPLSCPSFIFSNSKI